MPHVSDVRPTSHDRHDAMLVAALAADDLAGTDRDQAITLTRTCADCASLHDDLLALARATAASPPPFAAPTRDFRLTPADAARLRPSGWRRFVGALSAARPVAARPLGVGLATLGLVGLLVGNVQLGGSSAGALPQTVSTAAGSLAAPLPNADMVQPPPSGPAGLAPAAAGSAAPKAGSGSETYGGAVAASAPATRGAADAGGKAAATEKLAGGAQTGRDAEVSQPFRPLNVLFGAAVVLGIALLVASWLRGRRPV